MCGLSGEVRFDGSAADVDAVVRMSCVLAPRGPSGQGVWQYGRTAMAHRRLAIIDLSDAGGQPMVDSDLGLTIVFNGCVYNYRQLREELTGHGYTFFSTSDTEVVLKAFHRWGTDCVDHFLGMFAFVIAERDSGRTILVRDRLGIKPLYLSHSTSRLRFASSLPALLAGGEVDTSIDAVALQHYLTFHAVVPPPRTILTGVRKLPPATVRVIESDGSSRDITYWNPLHSRAEQYADLSAGDWDDLVLSSLRTAVQRRMVADVPVGVLLSGGIDSSVIVALLADEGQKGLQTFSIGFEAVGDKEGDEFEFSDIVAREFETDHHQLMIPSAEVLGGLGGAVQAMSEPMVSHDCVAFYLLSQQVSQHVKVVQSGQGADEILAGYDWYPPLAGVADDSVEDALAVYSARFFDRPHADMAGILQPQWLTDTDHSRALAEDHFRRPGADTALDRALRLDSLVMLVDDPVKRVDNMTMAWGLEARTPFLDHEFVELAAAVPPQLKLAHGGKGVLKQASRKVLPASVIDRKKGHFPVPAIINLEGRYLDRVRDALNAPEAKERGLFRADYVERLLTEPNRYRTNLGSNQLWQIGLLEMWLQQHGIR